MPVTYRCNLHVHDFSPHANVKFLHLAEPDDGRKLMRPSAAAFPLPPYDGPTHGISFGHDCMVIEFVSRFTPPRGLVAQRGAYTLLFRTSMLQ